jgi:hypothetical protein
MPDYKMYHLDAGGRIAGAPQEFVATDDDAALAEARERQRGMSAELWQGRRLLARLG